MKLLRPQSHVTEALPIAELEEIAETRPWFHSGGTGWLAIAVGIVLWDLTHEDQMTDAWKRAHKRGLVSALALGASWAIVTAHLYGLLPARYDPLHMIYIGRVVMNRGVTP